MTKKFGANGVFNGYEEDPVYLSRQYPKKPRKSLLYQ